MVDKKTITLHGKNVTIWKMNYGFFNDLQAIAAKITYDDKGKKEGGVDTRLMRLYGLVFGIYESHDLGIPSITESELEFGLNESTTNSRIKAVRNMDREFATELYEHITELNFVSKEQEKEIDSIKKD